MIQTNTKTVLLLCALMAGTTSMRADDTYTQVMSLDDIDTEATYILACIMSNGMNARAFGALNNSNYGTTISTSNVIGKTIRVASNASSKPLEFTINKSEEYYTLAFDNKQTYIGKSSGTSFLTTTSTPTEKYKWNIYYDETYSQLLIKAHDTNNYIMSKSDNTGVYASTYLTDANYGKTTLFKKNVVTISPNCTDGNKYFATYSSPFSFVVPSNLTVSEISLSEGRLKVEDYTTNNIVPANTGVMVSSTTPGNKKLVFKIETTGTSVLGSSNCLRPSGDAGITAAEMLSADSGCKFYRLTMHNGEQIGYWWGAADGGAFSVAANKAYLAVPEGELTSRSGFSLSDEETAIGQLLSDSQTSEETLDCYDLQGRKVTNSKLQKGLYIVNGRKVIRQ